MPDRNVRKRKLKRSQSAARKRQELEREFNALSVKPNKTPEEKAQILTLERAIAHLKLKEKQKSEPHARKGERH